MAGERILIVAPSWVGDAILSEPLVALLREPFEDPIVDVLAPPWCAPVYARMRGIRRIIETPFGHGKLDLAARRAARRASCAGEGYTRAFVLPNSWKSALVPWLARIPQRIGYVGEARWGLLTDARRLDKKAMPRLVDRFAALAGPPGELRAACRPRRCWCPTPRTAPPPMRALQPQDRTGRSRSCAPARSTAPPSAGRPTSSPSSRRCSCATACRCGSSARPTTRSPPTRCSTSLRRERQQRARPHRAAPTSARRSTSCRSASLVVSNDSGLMHAAAAVGVPLVALFGSSSPAYTPPLSPLAQIAKIDIACSPCFKRECPLGHFKCMRELKPGSVYNLARTALPA